MRIFRIDNDLPQYSHHTPPMNWIEIFRAGTHIDSGGTTHHFTASDLDRTVTSFDPSLHEPPLVIGHPEMDAPAWGWVAGLKREGNSLLASFKNVPGVVREAVEKGRYKKRSAAFYTDGRLRHVGLLGAAPPAVHGLKDIVAFASGEGMESYEFVSPLHAQEGQVNEAELKKRIAELEAENTLLQAKADGSTPEKVAELEAALKKLRGEKEAAEAAKEQAETAKQATEQAFAEAKKQARTAELQGKIDAFINEGRILPALASKVLAFAEHLDRAGELQFSETEGKKPVVSHFFEFLGSLPDNGLLAEFSAPANKNGGKDIPYNDIMNKV